MSIMNYVQVGLVLGVVFVIQVIKSLIDNRRKESNKKPIHKDLWVLVVLLCGIPMSIIIHGLENFINFNFFTIIRDIFIYSAAASFAYKTYSVGKRQITTIKGGNDG